MDNPHYVTPEEAKEKACAVDPQNWSCSGPSCMAWRWKEDFIFLDRYTTTGTLEITGSKYVYNYSATFGYCGMVRS